MPSKPKKDFTLDYIVAHACVDDDSATMTARDLIAKGYQPWGLASITSDSFLKTLQWVQIFVKKGGENGVSD